MWKHVIPLIFFLKADPDAFKCIIKAMGCPTWLQVNQINTDNEINNAYCLRMPQLDDLTDVCKDGNLLKVNSCNCAAELDEAKEGVSTASIIIRRKKSLKRKKQIQLQSMMQNKHLFYGCVSFRPKFRKPVMVNMSDLLLVVCGCEFWIIYFSPNPLGCRRAFYTYQR